MPDAFLVRLVVQCRDRPGIVAAVARLLADSGANITSSAQHSTDPEGGWFFLRLEFDLPGGDVEGLRARFAADVAEPFAMQWRMAPAGERQRIALLASREEHCLLDLLWRRRRGELRAEIAMVIANHPDHRADVEAFGVPYEHVPVARGGKPAAEERMLELLAAARVDLVVLARYMQVLSAGFLERVGAPVINIHHSFLPAFAGADPYARARERGVKIIGATAHYATEELDQGPIIEQDVARVDHRHTVGEMTAIGRDIERVVLGRAVAWHLDDRVLVHDNRTVVF
ncbi:MAG TPA: formyltetrahydrofolate deformylase [Baekduia sp.]|uniref:formyltetrahydrofolate deformylase n=1 Tax=Baekduia sp. TaxID=2600305 RepID=UPI002CBCB6A6|nr:formyltetrahydrofolate deformylase [Baekduia sp.]HMJ34879.1 formyltetrahydrofolate deformylase [Baekduia sp.]